MSKIVMAARILLGLIFFVFGLNGFFNFMPPPELTSEAAQSYMGGLAAAGFFFPVLKLTETVCGALLLIGRFVPLALTVLAPVVLQILLFHLLLEPAGLVLGIPILVLEIFLAWAYRGSFGGVLEAGAQPTA